MAVPVAPPLTDAERRSIHHFRTLRARIHDGPLYAILDPGARVHKLLPPTARSAGASFNAFEDQPTYTQRFRRARNTLPQLKKRPFVKELFPRELWAVMGVAETEGVAQQGQRKKLEISTRTRLDRWMKDAEDEEEEGGEGEEEKNDDDEGEENRDEEGQGEDVDPDQFDEDEEDENDDYNAEQYFSGGEDDDYGEDGGGGDDDY